MMDLNQLDLDDATSGNALTIVSAAALIAGGLALGGYFLSSGPQDVARAEPAVNHCEMFDSRAAISAVLMDIDRREDKDADLVTTKLQQTNVQTITKEVIERALVGEQVIVTQLTDDSNEPLLLHADRCKPSDKDEILTEGLGSGNKRVEETFNLPLKAAVKMASTPRLNTSTPLGAGLAGLTAHRSYMSSNPDIKRSLYIFSDFVEFSGECSGFKTGINTKECKAHLESIPADLRNTTVYAYQIVREFEGDVQKDVEEVWTAHFKANGATAVIWKKLR